MQTNEEIQTKIDQLERALKQKQYQYKNSFDVEGGWDEAKKLHAEIKQLEQALMIERSRLK